MKITGDTQHLFVMHTRKITCIVFFLCTCASYGQKTFKEYLNKNMVKTDTLANAVYYRVEKKDAGGRASEIKTYYMNDSLESEQYYINGKPSGFWVDYHRNGKKAHENEHKNDGTQAHRKWYENGQIKEEGGWQLNPAKGRNKLVINSFWDSTGVQTIIAGNGSLTEYSNGAVSYRETYVGGYLVKGICYDGDGKEWIYEKKWTYETDRERRPEFPGGIQAMYAFIKTHTKFPQEAERANVRGKVYVNFVIGSDGIVRYVTTSGEKLGYGCEEEAIRVVSMMPRWSPGIQDGKPVPVRYYLPLMFKK